MSKKYLYILIFLMIIGPVANASWPPKRTVKKMHKASIDTLQNIPEFAPKININRPDTVTMLKEIKKPEKVRKNSEEREKEKAAENLRDILLKNAMKHLGDGYKYGSMGPKNFDCSGFSSYIYKQVGINLLRSSRDQYTEGTRIKNRKDLLPGDLVFFARPGTDNIHHVGIVVESNKKTGHFTFIHASYTGVIISDSEEEYYKKRYYGATRMIN